MLYALTYYYQKIKDKLFPKPRIKEIIKEVIVEKKDPNGLIKDDIAYLRKHLGNKQYKLGDTLESVAYQRGQQSVLEFIETTLIRRQTNGPISTV